MRRTESGTMDEPYDSGMMDVEDGQQVYWSATGIPTAGRRSISTAGRAVGFLDGLGGCSISMRIGS